MQEGTQGTSRRATVPLTLGINTNVLVRFLVHDDEAQFLRSQKLIRREIAAGRPVFISLLVLLETEWVLRSRYDASKVEVATTISALLNSVDDDIEDEPAVEEALFLWKDHAVGFADCLIGARNRRLGCSATMTFDTKAARIPGFAAAS